MHHKCCFWGSLGLLGLEQTHLETCSHLYPIALPRLAPVVLSVLLLAVVRVCRLSLISFLIASAMDLTSWAYLPKPEPQDEFLRIARGMQVFLSYPMCTCWLSSVCLDRFLDQQLDPLGSLILPLHLGMLQPSGHCSWLKLTPISAYCTNFCLCPLRAKSYQVLVKLPSPGLYCTNALVTALCLSQVSALGTWSTALPFLPVLTANLAPDTLHSPHVQYCSFSHGPTKMKTSMPELKRTLSLLFYQYVAEATFKSQLPAASQCHEYFTDEQGPQEKELMLLINIIIKICAFRYPNCFYVWPEFVQVAFIQNL